MPSRRPIKSASNQAERVAASTAIISKQLPAWSPLLSMNSTLAQHRHHRERTRAREALPSQQPLNLNTTTRSPRLTRDPRLQHNRPSIVEPHRPHLCHRHPRRAAAQPALRPTPLHTTPTAHDGTPITPQTLPPVVKSA